MRAYYTMIQTLLPRTRAPFPPPTRKARGRVPARSGNPLSAAPIVSHAHPAAVSSHPYVNLTPTRFLPPPRAARDPAGISTQRGHSAAAIMDSVSATIKYLAFEIFGDDGCGSQQL
jgi:hypothetical protein